MILGPSVFDARKEKQNNFSPRIFLESFLCSEIEGRLRNSGKGSGCRMSYRQVDETSTGEPFFVTLEFYKKTIEGETTTTNTILFGVHILFSIFVKSVII